MVAILGIPRHISAPLNEAKMVERVAPIDGRRPHSGLPSVTFGVGDKLKLAFYERFAVEEDKWSARRHPRPVANFFLHQEISNDYTVQVDGAISVPLLGVVRVAGRDFVDVTRDLEAAFTAFTERRGFVNVTLAERSPIYVVGPVRQAGVYKFEPGLTAMHAVALAGGFERGQGGSSVEVARERARLKLSAKRLRRLLAQAAVLHAERDGAEAVPPGRLVALAGPAESAALVAEELKRRDATIRARGERRTALAAAAQAAERSLTIARGRQGHLTTNLSMRQERVKRLSSLNGIVDRAVIAQAQSELSDVQERNSDTKALISNAEQRLTQARQDEARLKTEIRIELDREIAGVEREIEDVDANLAAASSALGILSPSGLAGDGAVDESSTFEIIRQTSNGAEVIGATGTTPLRPGDLVRVLAGPERGG